MNNNPKELPGYIKKSFEMAYRGGMIWFEHLDGIYDNSELVIEKLEKDAITFCSPSISSLFCFVFDETVINDEIIDAVTEKIINTKKVIRKVCFVGVNKHYERVLKKILLDMGMQIAFINDLEKAKQWLV